MGNNTGVDKNQVVLEVKNLKKHFVSGAGRSKLVVPAVDGVTFDVYKGEVFGLVGESGCGKTTTGRTLMKLYSATEGYVKLNGDMVTAGYKGLERQVHELKDQVKEKMVELDQHAAAVFELEGQLDHDLIDVEHQLKLAEAEHNDKLKALTKPKDTYRDTNYHIKNTYELQVAKIEHQHKLAVAKIKESTKNIAREAYKHEVAKHQLGQKRKTEGLKESAALEKEVIAERLKKLEVQYEETYKALEAKYQPLIAKAEGQIVSKADAKSQIQDLNTKKKVAIEAAKAEYKKALAGLKKPDLSILKDQIKAEKTRYKSQVAELKKDMASLKDKTKEAIAKLPDKKASGVDQDAIDKKKAAILEWQKAEEKRLKDQIAQYKEVNKSKEALENSRKMQMIFQDPISSLNPRLTVEEIIGEGLVIRGGYSQKEIKDLVGETLEKVGLQRDYAARYPHEFSGGQRQRIGIARALIMNPDFIIADEPISALDVSIRAQVINLLHELKDELGLTILFIAHDLSVVRFFCDRIAVMYYGKIVEMAEAEELFSNPMHPYTKSLLSSVPQPDPDYEKNRTKISYNPAKVHDYRHDKPSLREVVPGHAVYVNDAEFEQIQKEYAENNESAGDA